MKNDGNGLKGFPNEREAPNIDGREVRRGILEAYGQEAFPFFLLADFHHSPTTITSEWEGVKL